MRTLIVDNYDSFTFNLAQYLAQLTGSLPTVLPNDAADWQAGELAGYDAVVISPGPGHPARPRDFGISAAVIAAARVPVLGVCLGHQGLCALAGGEVDLAPAPCHGRETWVRHDGTGAFAGLADPTRVVRYHSLAVTRVPSDFVVNAWTDDGIVMGVRHRQLPRWGVQFHPESIRTEAGLAMLANFIDLARVGGGSRAAGAGGSRPQVTLRQADGRAAQERGGAPSAPVGASSAVALAAGTPPAATPRRRVRVISQACPAPRDTAALFTALYGQSNPAFWLDSGAAPGRYSILGDASGPQARLARADVATGTVTVRADGQDQVLTTDLFTWLEQELAGWEVEGDPVPGDFALGWVGYLGYELKAQCGAAATHRAPTPDAALLFADRAVVVDHATATAHLLTLAGPGSSQWLAATAAVVAKVRAAQVNAAPGPGPGAAPSVSAHPDPAPAPAGPAPAAAPARPTPGVGRLSARHPRQAYLARIADCQAALRAGETYEVCLTNHLAAPGTLEPLPAYLRLRHLSPAPYGAFLRLAEVAVLSTSPEQFLRVDAAGHVTSRPIKGTRPRGTTPAADAALAAELAASEKDRAENLMIVDLVRNDLGVCAEPGTVQVPEIFAVESHARAHQLVSTVTAQLRAGVSPVRCVQAAFPGGSMTGAPKLRTMEIIDELEAGPRGVYSGALGYFSLTGAVDLSIVIRTLVVQPHAVSFGVGGAIIALSEPAAEWQETVVKAAALLDLLGQDFPG
ncbi:aminodeoxychorismate synthase component I [Buchananella hordeovulneris]|uniref:aminodeoxychorismate synthase component I n=1 Tax=Buchananella hordeovulneris TaxID=52770 RepID=UPI000F5FDC4F|nr:aminodeoxychorismate synthase component I [Buchananella hordeovulneris]RRD50646.1 aminodeoxychorismate synthase component I [Buchananella hordeovulneris]